jgi:Zn-dependent protease
MKWSFEVARPLGIPIRIHATFALILALGALQWGGAHGYHGALFGVLVMLGIFTCVALHELGHAIAARAYGLRVREIVLLPIGGVAALDGKPQRPLHELVIALAGPAVNVVIAGVLALAFASRLGLDAWSIAQPPSRELFVAVLLASNVMLVVFNLLPFFPLDGGRVVRAILSWRLGEVRATRIAAWVGQGGAVVLGIVGLLTGHVMLALVSVLLFLSAGAARAEAALPERLSGLRAADAVERGDVIATPAMTVAELRRLALTTSQEVFPVALGRELVGVLPRRALATAEHCHVGAAMRRGWLELDARTPLAEATELLRGDPVGVAAVRSDGALIGFLSLEHIALRVLPLASSGPSALAPRASHAPS